MNGFPFSKTEQDLFRYIFAIVLFGLGFAYLHLRDRDPLYNTYLVKGVVVFSFGLAFTFGDNALSTALAIEAAALLVSARRSGLVVTRVLAFLVAAAAFLQAASTLSTQTPIQYGEEGFNALAFQAAATVFAFFLMAFVYTHTDWTRRLPQLLWLDQYTRATLARFNFCEPPPNIPVVQRPFDGLLFAYVYAAAAALLFVPYVSVLVQDDYALIALALGARRLRRPQPRCVNTSPLGLTAVIVTAAAAGIPSLQWLDAAAGTPETVSAIVALAALIAHSALATERWLLPDRKPASLIHQSEAGPYFFYGAVAVPLALFLIQEFDGLPGVLAIAAAAIAFAGAYTVLHPGALAVYAAALFGWAALHGIVLARRNVLAVRLRRARRGRARGRPVLRRRQTRTHRTTLQARSSSSRAGSSRFASPSSKPRNPGWRMRLSASRSATCSTPPGSDRSLPRPCPSSAPSARRSAPSRTPSKKTGPYRR
jgi:hypothetical protein